MGRVKISFPEKTIFNTSITGSVEQLNYGNHVGNDRFLSFCHEARLRFLKTLGQSELDFFSTSLIMADAELSYKAQAYHGDTLKIELAAQEQTPKSFSLFYKLTNQKGDLVSLVRTGMVYFDYENNKVVSAPEDWLRLLV